MKINIKINCRHTWKPPLIKGAVEFSKFFKKGWGSDFSLKKGGVGKIRGGCFKKGRYHSFSYNSPFLVLSFSEFLVCVYVCVFCLFTPFLSKEEPNLITSNQ